VPSPARSCRDSPPRCRRSVILPRRQLSRAGVLGEECGQWAQGAFELRGAESLRSIMGLCGFIKNHSATAINGACAKGLKAGTYRFKDLRRLPALAGVMKLTTESSQNLRF
jgi:hypothetical protein